MRFKFKEEHTLEHRRSESSKIRDKYPERIPVIVEKEPKSHIASIDKRKFLVPSDISVAQFMWIIRKRIQLPSEKAIFLFVGKVLPQSSASMGQIYEDHKDEDGFLYIAYSGENTFGFCDDLEDNILICDPYLCPTQHGTPSHCLNCI